jgi:hypothetical protein
VVRGRQGPGMRQMAGPLPGWGVVCVVSVSSSVLAVLFSRGLVAPHADKLLLPAGALGRHAATGRLAWWVTAALDPACSGGPAWRFCPCTAGLQLQQRFILFAALEL